MNSSQPDTDGPRLSVVMPVYNALPYLDAAVESILRQTFSDFEFIILDDASTDGSTERLREWAARDGRIRLLEVKKNLGPSLSSERVARAATAPFVARMDADDISYPDRLREQLEVLTGNPQVGVVGCLAEVIDSKDRQLRSGEVWRAMRQSLFVPFAHGATAYRRTVFEQVGGYRKECVLWEDQDLITRMAAVSEVLVIPRVLYRVRQSDSSTRFASGHDRHEQALDLMFRCLDRLEQGQEYDSVLDQPVAEDGKIDPRSYISLGSVVLWAGRRPRLFRRALRRGRLSLDFATASAIVWTAWASVTPGSLRLFLILLLRLRNGVAKTRLRSSQPISWSPRPAAAVPSAAGDEQSWMPARDQQEQRWQKHR